MFDWAALRAAYKSYVDSIVIELCLPNSQYPKYILARILEDATQEAPREKERFPQALFDALGDLSVSVYAVFMSLLLTECYLLKRSRLRCKSRRSWKPHF
jgi:hypothetical protein